MFKERLNARWFALARWMCKVFCNLFFRLSIEGRENVPKTGPLILVSNHQSYLDPVLCGITLKRHLWFLARESLFSNWFFGWLIGSVNTIPVNRDKPGLSSMRKVIDKLKEGKGICLFPEGTRSIDGRIAPFKPGFGLLCRRGNAAVVPVLVDGAFECWPRHKKLFSRGPILICYGQALTAEQVSNMSDDELAQSLTDTLRQMQNRHRTTLGKKPFEY